MKPAVVLKAQFITPNTKSRKNYSSYIDYINRKDALNKSEKSPRIFSDYIDYMNDRKKGAFGFDDSKDKLEKENVLDKAKIFDSAKNDNRVLWQDVYSFDNKFLEEENLYNSRTKELDSKSLINSVRESMNKFKKDQDIDQLVWTGAIHRNTDNIHIHVASVNMDKNVERDENGIQRGYRSEKTINNMKSKFVNNLLDRNNRLDIMTKQRDQIVKVDFFSVQTETQKHQLDEIKKRLPENKNKWNYNRKEIKKLQPLIDEYTNEYIKKNHKKKYDEYNKMLDKEVELNKRLYGEGTKEHERYKDTKTNKLNELNERMGNTLLNHLKDDKHLKTIITESQFYHYSEERKHNTSSKVVKRKVISNPLLNKRTQFMIERGFNSRYKDQKLEMDNKRLEQSIEQEKSRQAYEHDL